MKNQNKFDEFRLARKLIVFNRFVQAFLLLTLIVGVNLFAMKFKIRWDITTDRTNSLSAESFAHIQQFKGSVSIYVVMNEALQLPGGRFAKEDIESLLDQYLDAATRVGLDSFSVEYVNIYRDREKVLRLKQDFDFDQENVILLNSPSRRRVIAIQDMYKRSGSSDALTFHGEQILTGAILEVSDPTDKQIFFTAGHGEMQLGDVDPVRGLSELSTYFDYQSISLKPIDLSRYESVPDYVDMLVIASPQAAFGDDDVEKLRRYIEKTNGSIVLFLEPFRKHNLDDLLYDWGILCDDAVIIDPGSDYQASSGNLILRLFAEHPITQPLFDHQLPVYSNRPRPVRLDQGVPRVAGVQRTALLATSKTSWIETGFREQKIPEFDVNQDVAGPVPVCVLSERRSADALGLKLKGGKFIVFGDASIISNQLFGLYGNKTLITNSFNWCLQRNHLLSIPPQKIQDYRLTVSEADLNSLMITLMILPGVLVVMGLIVRIIRR